MTIAAAVDSRTAEAPARSKATHITRVDVVRDLAEVEAIWREFEARAAGDPDAVAVLDGDRALSYRELEQRANRLAHTLIGWGVAPEALVALVLPRSVASVVARLAVAKAGGAFLQDCSGLGVLVGR